MILTLTPAQRNLLEEAVLLDTRLARAVDRHPGASFAAYGIDIGPPYDPVRDVLIRSWDVLRRWREALEWLLLDAPLPTRAVQELMGLR